MFTIRKDSLRKSDKKYRRKALLMTIFLASILLGTTLPVGYAEEATEAVSQEVVQENSAVQPYERGKVIKLLEHTENTVEMSETDGVTISNQWVEVLILKGPLKGQTFEAEYALNNGFSETYKVQPLEIGDEVLLHMEKDEAGNVSKVFVAEFARDKAMLWLMISFVLLLLLVGRSRGLKALISLTITIFAVIKIMLPAILNGWDPVIVSAAICIGVIIISMLLLNGVNKKTVAAVIGTSGGVIAAGIIALIFGGLARLSGMGEEETQMLMYIPQGIVFNFRGLLFSGILISTMGATMDVGMSVASAMNEMKAINPEINPWQLVKSGMNVGRDVIGTMTDTLILAYAGSSLPLMLLFMAYDTPFSQIVNWDMISSEILRAIAGSIGIIIAVPMTVLSMVAIEANQKHRKRYKGI